MLIVHKLFIKCWCMLTSSQGSEVVKAEVHKVYKFSALSY